MTADTWTLFFRNKFGDTVSEEEVEIFAFYSTVRSYFTLNYVVITYLICRWTIIMVSTTKTGGDRVMTTGPLPPQAADRD